MLYAHNGFIIRDGLTNKEEIPIEKSNNEDNSLNFISLAFSQFLNNRIIIVLPSSLPLELTTISPLLCFRISFALYNPKPEPSILISMSLPIRSILPNFLYSFGRNLLKNNNIQILE